MHGNATTSETITCVMPANLIAQMDAQVGSSFVDREDSFGQLSAITLITCTAYKNRKLSR